MVMHEVPMNQQSYLVVQYRIVQYSTVQYSTVQTVQFSIPFLLYVGKELISSLM